MRAVPTQQQPSMSSWPHLVFLAAFLQLPPCEGQKWGPVGQMRTLWLGESQVQSRTPTPNPSLPEPASMTPVIFSTRHRSEVGELGTKLALPAPPPPAPPRVGTGVSGGRLKAGVRRERAVDGV